MTTTLRRGASAPVSDVEAAVLFADLAASPALVLAVSGGPDSTALLLLSARWRAGLARGPKLLAVTVDHGLRSQSQAEAAAVKRLAARLGVAHRTVRWRGAKPSSGLQEAARLARYRLLAAQARQAGATAVVTAHTMDDQAETVLLRLARGSGIGGLAAMARHSRLPDSRVPSIGLVRPFLDLAKARLIATLQQAKLESTDDPSNRDPRFTRSRLRRLMPLLAEEGLDARRLTQFASRARRMGEAIEWSVAQIVGRLPPARAAKGACIVLDLAEFRRWPHEIALQVVRRGIERVGNEGRVQLGKLESLVGALRSAAGGPTAVRFRRTLAGAMVTLRDGRVAIERAPERRSAGPTRKRAAKVVPRTASR